jgi:hypothetical protein
MFSTSCWLDSGFLVARTGNTLGVCALCGLFFALNPQMVFPDVGTAQAHDIAYLPWILYFTKRLFDKPTPGRAAWLAGTFGHGAAGAARTGAYYGAMMMGPTPSCYSREKELSQNIRATLMMAAAGSWPSISSPLTCR